MEILNSKTVGDANKKKILDLIKSQHISRVEIAEILGISRPAVTKNINALLKTGLIKEGYVVDSSVGRKPQYLEFNNRFKYVMGINIRSKHIEIALADLIGSIIEKNTFHMASKDNPEVIYKQILDSINDIVNKQKVKLDDILFVGISSPGIRNIKTAGYVLNPFVEHWDQLDIVDMIKRDLNLDCIMFNDVDMSILAEKHTGVCKDYNNIAYLKLWDGFAARFMVDGHIIHGSDYAAGEIGFMVLGDEYIKNHCDVSGVLEKSINNDALSEMYKNYAKSYGQEIDYIKDYNIKDMFELEEKGDRAAKQVVDTLEKLIAMVIINITTVLNPEVAVLGGDLINVSNDFINNINSILSNNFPFPPVVLRGKIDKDNEIIGCISIALEEADKKLQLLW